uniref:Rhophilin-2-like isoform X1 n=1 Tax=Petromyzon marinus TaxID=7757 RepID=A0AAJ7WX43_PETMA|nr:rhophilin-2-like isoform X1 [Petromyzon marinus]
MNRDRREAVTRRDGRGRVPDKGGATLNEGAGPWRQIHPPLTPPPPPPPSVSSLLGNPRCRTGKLRRARAASERATNNNKVKETVALELSFVNSNLQLLKEELAELNSSMEIYQNDSEGISVPLIPLGLKETKEVDFLTPFKAFIEEHYGECGEKYEEEIKDLLELRQAMRTPRRNEVGVELLMEYYNQLYFVENRFCPPHRHSGVFFTWYDSLTGMPACQRTLAFERGSVLFNVGALYTQIGARQDRTAHDGLHSAIDAFQKAAGAFNYLKENFTHAPTLDMSPASLTMLVRLMAAQVQECVFERFLLQGLHNDVPALFNIAQEATRVSDVYNVTHQTMDQTAITDYVPVSWRTMVRVKSLHFLALSHHYVALALLEHSLGPTDDADLQEKLLSQLHVEQPEWSSPLTLLRDNEERRKLGKAHLRKAIMQHEEALRVHNFCKPLRRLDILQEVLAFGHERSLSKYSLVDEEDDFFVLIDVPDITPKSLYKAEMKPPDFSKIKVMDFFHELGPLSVFSAKHSWTSPRSVKLVPCADGYGLVLRGDSPVRVATVETGSVAELAGVKNGDCIVALGGEDCKWAKHVDVVEAMRSADAAGVTLLIVSPLPSESTSTLERRTNATFPLSSSSPSHAASGMSKTSGRVEQVGRARSLLPLGWLGGVKKSRGHNTLPGVCFSITSLGNSN